jgi:tetratricopeptide (TPR) repeat protein
MVFTIGSPRRQRFTHSFYALMIALAANRAAQGQQPASIYEQAATLIQSAKASDAIALIEPRLQTAPQDLKALTLMGMAMAADNRREQANQYFERALQANPVFAPALKNLALNEVALGRTANARSDLERLLQLTPSDPIAHLALAEIQVAVGDLPNAISHYERSGDLLLRNPSTLIRLAQAYVATKQPDKAAQSLARLPPGADAGTHFTAGTVLASIKNYPAAAREFERARKDYANPYDAGFNLMLAYSKAGQPAAAVRVGEELVRQGYRRAEQFNVLGRAYEAAGNTVEAYNALREATKIDPADASNYLDLISLCLTHKNYDLALEIADISVARLPQSDSLHLQRGIVLAMKEDFRGARTEFESAVKLAPQRNVGYVALGLILLQLDKTDEAIKVLRQRASTGGGDYAVLWFLGEALTRSGAVAGSNDDKEAVDALSRSVSLNPDVAQSRVLLAKLLARRGELDTALQHLNRTLELDPGNITATYQLAQIYQRKGDAARAKELFAKVSKAKADDRERFTRGGLQVIVREGSR